MCQVVAKVFSIALLATTSAIWLIAWLSSDLLLYMLYKAARRDFVYFVPGLTGAIKFVVAFVMRLAIKVLTDVTGSLKERNAYEMGGVYFAFSTAASQASCWIAASLYVAHYNNIDENKIDAVTIYVFIGALQGLWAMTLILFFGKIKRAYWKTFYSTQSGRQNAMSLFLDHQDDESKAKVFLNHEDMWSDIRGEVKEYTLKNWGRWESEKPTWFDENFKAGVPDEFIPKAALDDLNKQHGGKRRRSSVGKVEPLGGGERRGSAIAPELRHQSVN